jgi:hypothetical protein
MRLPASRIADVGLFRVVFSWIPYRFMRAFRINPALQRQAIAGFELPLGIVPGQVQPPLQGYTISFNEASEDEPDTYTFHVVVSQPQLAPIVRSAFTLLPDEVMPILEIGSRDAYRAMDVYIGEEPISRRQFVQAWQRYESFLLEDCSIGAGANAEEPFVEIFVDAWKSLAIHSPMLMRDEVEAMLTTFNLEEVPYTWPFDDNDPQDDDRWTFRPVLDLSAPDLPDVDDLLMLIRHDWNLVLNVDPDTNVDEAGRELGHTLWHALAAVSRPVNHESIETFVSIWATASSLTEVEQMVAAAVDDLGEWQLLDIESIDRMAYDDRPTELADLQPRRFESEVHLVVVENTNETTP